MRPVIGHDVERRWGWFLAWFVVGAAFALGVLTALTIGMFVLPVAVALTVLLATRRHASDGLAGAISGLGLPLLYVGYLNRAGPGTVCTGSSGRGTSCTDEWTPLPWVIAGMALIAAGVVVFIILGRVRARTSA